MKTIIRYLIPAAVILAAEVLPAQEYREMSPMRKRNLYGKSLFAYQAYNFADSTSEEKSLMDIHIELVNDLLTFIRTEDKRFRARYEITVVVFGEKNELLAEQSTSGRAVVSSFEETNSRDNPHRHLISLSLPVGRYNGQIRLTDLESNETLQEELKLNFRRFNRRELHLSDIMFVDKIDSSENERRYRPNVRNLFDDLSSAFAAYVELYPPENGEQTDVLLSISSRGQKLFEARRTYDTPARAVALIVPFREHLTRPGDYTLLVAAQCGRQTAKVQRMFSVSWSNLPLRENNIDLAIEQLAVIADKRTIEAMRQADAEERQRLFEKFWKDRDPTPDTERNELKEEFFRRIDFCNANFTEIAADRQGWQSERGRIYLVYGPPDAVERQERDMNTPAVEIWTYQRLNRRYTFVDRLGDGVYRLVKVD